MKLQTPIQPLQEKQDSLLNFKVWMLFSWFSSRIWRQRREKKYQTFGNAWRSTWPIHYWLTTVLAVNVLNL